MKDVIADVVKHTAGLGFIENVKVTGTDSETTLDAMDSDRTVILKAKLHNVQPDFIGEFGLGNLGFLSGVSKLPNYAGEDATVEVVKRERNGVQAPDHLLFKDSTNNTDRYRFMSKEIIDQTLQTVKFKGAAWEIEFQPAVASIQRLKFQSQAHSSNQKLRLCRMPKRRFAWFDIMLKNGILTLVKLGLWAFLQGVIWPQLLVHITMKMC